MSEWKELTVKIKVNGNQYARLETINEVTRKTFPDLTIEDELSLLIQNLINRDLDKELDCEEISRNIYKRLYKGSEPDSTEEAEAEDEALQFGLVYTDENGEEKLYQE